MIPAASHSSASLRRNPFSRIHNGSITARLRYTFAVIFLIINFTAAAQTDSTPVFKNAIAANRSKTYSNIVKNIIIKNLSLPLTDSTEENWQGAFYAMELTGYHTKEIDEKIKIKAFDSIEKRSSSYKRQLLEMVYTIYPDSFTNEVLRMSRKTFSSKLFAMQGEYLMSQKKSYGFASFLFGIGGTMGFDAEAVLDSSQKQKAEIYKYIFEKRMEKEIPVKINKLLKEMAAAFYLPRNTIIYSIQRKNRNYPGIAVVRDSTGKFITDSSGNIFSVPQLARSINNLPGYLTNGNTPQGIFRINGFAVSGNAAIGPTENIQLLMPYETSPQYFLKDSSITDTAWTKELYQRLLPKELKNYYPLYGTYYASAIGRTEIIAHGTTVDPDYYKGQSYYPHTPTMGCLCTKEIWSAATGKRTESNQQKLVDAVKKAGGANGYLIVIEIDDQQKPVNINEIISYLKPQNIK